MAVSERLQQGLQEELPDTGKSMTEAQGAKGQLSSLTWSGSTFRKF